MNGSRPPVNEPAPTDGPISFSPLKLPHPAMTTTPQYPQASSSGAEIAREGLLPVGLPGVEHLVGDGGQITDMDPAAVEVEAERLSLAVTQGERGAAFGGVGEADEFVQPGGTMVGGDVP